MLKVLNLSRQYGDFIAVDDVSFEIGKGEIVGLLGHNGAGKTTIMRMISGFLEPNQGTISIDNLAIAENINQAQQHLGYLPENLPIYPELTVADYIDYAAELKGLKDDDKHSEINRVIVATELEDKLLSTIGTLSRGYKQRVGVAQALLGKPRLLILDEPTNGLDPTQTQHMRDLIRELAKDATVILSTHIMQEVDALCSRVLIIRSGKMAVDAKLSDLKQSQSLLLSTSANLKTVTSLLNPLDSVATIDEASSADTPNTPANGANYFKLTSGQNSTQSIQTLSADVAKVLIDNKQDLYQLQPVQQDLEMLFRQVNDSTTSEPSSLAI